MVSRTSESGGDPVLGRRERKKLATRAAVQEAAVRLAVRFGVENVTVEQIAAEADIALRTFFNYFPSKEHALVAFTASGADALVAAFRARPATESVLDSIRGSVLVVMSENISASRTHIDALRLISEAPSLWPHQLAILTGYEKALATAIAERVGPGDTEGLYPSVCAAASIASLRVVVARCLARPGGFSLEEFRSEFDKALAELGAGFDRPPGA
ncbi:TetR family transcriptional regulator [Saccharomonospora sp. NPDC006951]